MALTFLIYPYWFLAVNKLGERHFIFW